MTVMVRSRNVPVLVLSTLYLAVKVFDPAVNPVIIWPALARIEVLARNAPCMIATVSLAATVVAPLTAYDW